MSCSRSLTENAFVVQLMSIDLISLSQVARNVTHFFNSSTLLLRTKQTLGNTINEFCPMLKLNPLTPLAIAQKKSITLQFLLESLVEDFRVSALQNFSYDNFLKILKPVYVFSFAHNVFLLLLQLRG